MNYLITEKSQPGNSKIISDILNSEVFYYSIQEFTGKEKFITIENMPKKGSEIYIYKELWPNPNEKLIELFLLLDLLSSAELMNLNLIIPFIPYLRQDRSLARHSTVGARAISNLIATFPVSKIFTFDIHSKQGADLFKCEIRNMNYYEYFANKLYDCKILSQNSLVVAPDFGASERAASLGKMLGAEYTYLTKERKNGKIFSSNLRADRKYDNIKYDNIILVDDIMDTGGTITSAITHTRPHANQIFLCISHILKQDVLGDICKEYQEVRAISPTIATLTKKELEMIYSQIK